MFGLIIINHMHWGNYWESFYCCFPPFFFITSNISDSVDGSNLWPCYCTPCYWLVSLPNFLDLWVVSLGQHCSESWKFFNFMPLSEVYLLIVAIHLKDFLLRCLKSSSISLAILSIQISGSKCCRGKTHCLDMSLRYETHTRNVWCHFDFCCYWKEMI